MIQAVRAAQHVLPRGKSGRRVFLLFSCLILMFLSLTALGAPPALADEGWVINSFAARIQIEENGALRIAETILVDFGNQRKHGIFRKIPVYYDFGDDMERVYDLEVLSVTDSGGRRWKYEVERDGKYLSIKIGDPDVTVTGVQSYVIDYRVQHALNGFADHDELYWNVNGEWPVRTVTTEATVTLPGDGVRQVTCFQGAAGSLEPCRFSNTARAASFGTTRLLPEGEQLTVVVAMAKGLVPDPQFKLERKPREFAEFFEATPVTVGGSLFALVVSLAGLGWAWWRYGRDRRYTSVYYLTDNPNEETRPLLASDPIVIEYSPPDNLRPGQLGLILDETADTLDVTSTTIDLAVRGYLHIREVKTEGILGGLFSKRDWELTRTEKDDAALLVYEQTVLRGLFDQGSPVGLSQLKNKFYKHLRDAKRQLYDDVMQRKWFVMRPDKARGLWVVFGVLLLTVGVVAMVLLGMFFGAGLIGLPLILAGTLLSVLAFWMPKRTAKGREALRRALGFRQYVATAETDRQRFNEAANLFAEYLPYAIVFHCVDKWARAFRDVDMQAATQTWYAGGFGFAAAQFSHDMQDFSSSVSSTIVSTPGGSGSSGFGSGGFSGGGGGGGGGGGW